MTTTLLTLTIAALAFVATGCSVSPARDATASATKSTASAARQVSPDGFEYVGGESGWQLEQHKLAYRDGRFVHAADCPVEIAKAGGSLKPTPGA